MAIRLTESQLRNIINDVIMEEKAYRRTSVSRKRINESKLGFGLNPGMAMAQAIGLAPSLFAMSTIVGIMGLVIKCSEPDPLTADEAAAGVNSNIVNLVDSIEKACDSSIKPKYFIDVEGQCEILKANVDILEQVNPASAQEIKNTCAEVLNAIPSVREQIHAYADADPDLNIYDPKVYRVKGGKSFKKWNKNPKSFGYTQRFYLKDSIEYLSRLQATCRDIVSGN